MPIIKLHLPSEHLNQLHDIAENHEIGIQPYVLVSAMGKRATRAGGGASERSDGAVEPPKKKISPTKGLAQARTAKNHPNQSAASATSPINTRRVRQSVLDTPTKVPRTPMSGSYRVSPHLASPQPHQTNSHYRMGKGYGSGNMVLPAVTPTRQPLPNRGSRCSPATPLSGKGSRTPVLDDCAVLDNFFGKIPSTPDFFSNPWTPERPLPHGPFTALDEHMRMHGVYDEVDRLYINGVNYGIGLGVLKAKEMLMDELVAKGTLFGRRVHPDIPNDSVIAMRARIESKTKWDCYVARKAGDQYVNTAANIAGIINASDPYAVIQNGGMIRTHGLIHPFIMDGSTPMVANLNGIASQTGPNGLSLADTMNMEVGFAGLFQQNPAAAETVNLAAQKAGVAHLDGVAGIFADAFMRSDTMNLMSFDSGISTDQVDELQDDSLGPYKDEIDTSTSNNIAHSASNKLDDLFLHTEQDDKGTELCDPLVTNHESNNNIDVAMKGILEDLDDGAGNATTNALEELISSPPVLTETEDDRAIIAGMD